MKNISDFRRSKKEVSKAESPNYEQIEDVEKVYWYSGVEIALLNSNKYYLVLGREDFIGELEELEILAWNFYKEETNILTD